MKLKVLLGALAATSSGIAYDRFLIPEPDRLVFLSVGQGDCAVLQSHGITVLIDAGPKTDRFDGGERIVVPELRKLGVQRIDLVLLSHPDMDHVGGLIAIRRHFRIGKVGLPAYFRYEQKMISELGMAGLSDRDPIWFTKRQYVKVGTFEVRIDVPPYKKGDPDNDGSMFVRVATPKATAVFSGDASQDAELKMLDLSQDWQAQILKAGHHGSRTATSPAWLNAVHPKFAILSCGRNNNYGHPHPDVIRKLRDRGIETIRTDEVGTVEFQLGSNGFEKVR